MRVRLRRFAPTGRRLAPHLLAAAAQINNHGAHYRGHQLVEEAVAEALPLGGAVGPPLRRPPRSSFFEPVISFRRAGAGVNDTLARGGGYPASFGAY